MVSKFGSGLIAAGLGCVVGITGAAIIGSDNLRPDQAYVQSRGIDQDGYRADLNRDAVPDMIIQQEGGWKIPLYGIKEGDSTIYVSASELIKRRGLVGDSKQRTEARYKDIESQLNKH